MMGASSPDSCVCEETFHDRAGGWHRYISSHAGVKALEQIGEALVSRSP